MPLTPCYRFHDQGYGVIGARTNYPEEFWQNTPSVRTSFRSTRARTISRSAASFFIGTTPGGGVCSSVASSRFNAVPPDLERRFPIAAWNDPSKWDLSGLDSSVLSFTQSIRARGRPGDGQLSQPLGLWELEPGHPPSDLGVLVW